MYCLRWWIPLFLLPFPKTSPLFLILFLISFTLHSKPCIYCAVILTGLFSSSAYWYTPTISTSSSSSPRIRYGWLDFGHSGANGFWNPLLRESDFLSSSSSSPSTPNTTTTHLHLSIPWTLQSFSIPKRFYLGLGSHNGLGVYIQLVSDPSSSLVDPQIITPSLPIQQSSLIA